MTFLKLEKPVIVLNHGMRLSDDQIKEAFAGQSKTFWYRALVQELNDLREQNALNASQAASTGNTLAMAGGLNVYEAFTALIAELAKKTGDNGNRE